VRICTTASLGILAVLVLTLAGCGGGEEPQVVTGSESPGLGSVFKEMRRDVSLGEGGWFKFTIGSVEYPTEWGYADFHASSLESGSRLVLLNNPIGRGQFPLLRLVIFAGVSDPTELEGQTVEKQMLVLKMEKKKGKGLDGSASVTFTAVDEKWVEGSFSGSIEQQGQTLEIEGSFKARLNIPEETK